MMDPAKYFDIIAGHFGTDRLTELIHTNEFTLAVAVVLSAQTTDKMVNRATPGLFAAADTPEKMLELGENGLKEHIKSLSFFNNKAANIIKMAGQLADAKQKGRAWKFPEEYRDRNELMKLAGIGQKTANVVSNVLWGMPNIGVDTHVFRLAHRFGWAAKADNTPEKAERRLLQIIPQNRHGVCNHLMVMHGRYICKAQRPDCANCHVKDICEWKIVEA